MQLLGQALEFVYQAVLDRRATKLFSHLSETVSDQIYDGRWFDPTTVASMIAIKELTKRATGRVRVGAYKGNIFFLLYRKKICCLEEADLPRRGRSASSGRRNWVSSRSAFEKE